MFGDLRTRRSAAGLLGAAAVLIVGTGMQAQTIKGAVSGTVTDASGATVKGATVRATAVSTNVSSTAVSNDGGIYALRFLQIGQYELEILAPGFTPYTVGPITVETNQQLKLDAEYSFVRSYV